MSSTPAALDAPRTAASGMASRHSSVVVHPGRLSEADATDWRALCALHPDYANPLLGPDFAVLAGSVRTDARVALIRSDRGELDAVLAFHDRPLGLARPIGAPFSDYSGPVTRPGSGLGLADILALAGVGAYRAANVADPFGLFEASGPLAEEASYYIRRGEESDDAFVEGLRAQHAKRFKNFRRLDRKLEAERGELLFLHGRPDPVRLARLLEWKSAQFQREGLVDITKATNPSAILEATARAEGPGVEGFMTCLTLNGELLSGHFGARADDSFHPWISAYDPAYAEFAPGILLLLRVVQNMKAMGLVTYDLAGGHGHYKKYFSTHTRRTREVACAVDSAAGRLQAAGFGAWELAGARNAGGPAGRLRRRLDHIAACEPGLPARVREFAIAVSRRANHAGGTGHAEPKEDA